MWRYMHDWVILGMLAILGMLIGGCSRREFQEQPLVTEPSLVESKTHPPSIHDALLIPPTEPEGGWRAYRVAATILTRTHPFYKDLEDELRLQAQKYNLNLEVQSSDMKPDRQRAQIQNFVVSGYDAIIVCPADSDAIGGAIRIANDAHIPVFTADIAANEGDVVCHIASDNVQGGRLAGEYLANLLGGKGKVIIIDHPTVTSVQDRVRGFEEALAKYPDIKIVDRPAANGQRPIAKERTQNALMAIPDVEAIFGINDDSALGALAALRQANREDVIVVGYDAVDEARKEILADTPLKADVIQYPREIARLTIEAVVKYLNGEDVPDTIPVPVGIVDRQALLKEGAAGGAKE
ncbi:MAG: substrate-binding domain-containing protein [Candidatus Zipacnadales bacterium]